MSGRDLYSKNPYIVYHNNDNIRFLKTLKSDFSSVRPPITSCVVENFAAFYITGVTEK